MKNLLKIFMILGLVPILFQHNVNAADMITSAEETTKDRFINPLFYQNLSNDTFFYVLTPDSKYCESDKIISTVTCELIENEQYHISLICGDCVDAMCLQQQKRTHDFLLLKNMQDDKLYPIKHEVTDNVGNSILQEDLTTDGYIARRSDLL